jgi:hypothetical protein
MVEMARDTARSPDAQARLVVPCLVRRDVDARGGLPPYTVTDTDLISLCTMLVSACVCVCDVPV